MSRGSKDLASRLTKFRDADQEFKETKSEEARERRHDAMFSEGTAVAKRAAEILATRAWEEGQARNDRLRRARFSGWTKK